MRNRKVVWTATLATVAVVLLAVAGWLVWKPDNTTGGNGASDGTHPSGQVSRVTVWIDGWSHATLGTSRLSTPPADGGVATRGTPLVTPRPASVDDVADLAQRAPHVLAEVAARMITADSQVTCAASGCTTSNGTAIPLEWFTNPSDIPGLGEVYQQWGITSLLHYTSFSVPDEPSAMVSVEAEGFIPHTYTFLTTSDNDTKPVTDVTLAAGIGRLFPIVAGWRDNPGKLFDAGIVYYENDGVVENADLVREWQPLGFTGLNDPTTYVTSAGFSPSALTYYTSPTTGCSAYTCTPTTVEAEIQNHTNTLVKVCVVDETFNTAGVVRVEDTTYTVKYPHATMQTGLWNGTNPADFPGTINGDWRWTGEPPTVTGPQQVRMVRYWFSATPDEAPWQVLSQTFQLGVDEVPADYNPASAERINTRDPSWQVCP